MANQHILVVEENHKERTALSRALEEWGYHVAAAHDGYGALKKLKSESFGLVITSYEIPGLGGHELFQQSRTENEGVPFLFLSQSGSVADAVQMMKAGAIDFILKPAEASRMRLVVQRALEGNGNAHSIPRPASRPTRIVTQDDAMERLLRLARQVADSRAAVLIQGESGTGKELFARYIHENSSRCKGPFVAVNCGALPETLLESELFGHEKGAFTGAVSKKPGKFELANGGTLLLDEITEMAFHLQSKLLRVLQEQEIDRVGGLRPVPVDVRIIATTNRKIEAAVEKEMFREDLFYRLNVIPLRISPLRNRRGDIPLLAQHFVEKYNELDGRNVKSLTKEALETLNRFPLKGNVRELENIIERAVLLCEGDRIQAKDLLLTETLEAPRESGSDSVEPQGDWMVGPLKEVEKKIIFRTLDETEGNRTHAAKILGISVRTLRNKLNEYKGTMDAL